VAEVVWTEEALSDLNAIGEYCDRTSPQYASVIVDTLYTSVERLTEHSKMGRQVPEVEHESLRELIVENYRVIYQLRGEEIEVIRSCLADCLWPATSRISCRTGSALAR
jgi:addiction module RelE/StbE family toxin